MSATSSAGTCEIRRNGRAGERVVCRIGPVGPNDTVRILVAGRAVRAGTSRDIVTVASASGAGDASNNVASARSRSRPRTAANPPHRSRGEPRHNRDQLCRDRCFARRSGTRDRREWDTAQVTKWAYL